MNLTVDAGTNTVFLTGGSLAVVLPKKFVEENDIRKGDPMPFVVIGDTIRFFPMDRNHPTMKALRASDEKPSN